MWMRLMALERRRRAEHASLVERNAYSSLRPLQLRQKIGQALQGRAFTPATELQRDISR